MPARYEPSWDCWLDRAVLVVVNRARVSGSFISGLANSLTRTISAERDMRSRYGLELSLPARPKIEAMIIKKIISTAQPMMISTSLGSLGAEKRCEGGA